MRTIVPIASIYEYDSSIFTDIYSAGFSKDELIEHFLLTYGDLTPVYQSPAYLRRHVTSVAKSLKWSIDRLWELTQQKYNALENYDRMEEWTDDGNGTFQKGTVSTSGTYQKGRISTTDIENSGTTHSVAAFNSSSAELANKDDATRNASGTTTYGEDSSSGTESHDIDTSNSTTTHSGRIHGNIGVMTSQQMFQQELEVIKTNFLDAVCTMYADRILIGVW